MHACTGISCRAQRPPPASLTPTRSAARAASAPASAAAAAAAAQRRRWCWWAPHRHDQRGHLNVAAAAASSGGEASSPPDDDGLEASSSAAGGAAQAAEPQKAAAAAAFTIPARAAINPGACPQCGGTGRVACRECGGEGRLKRGGYQKRNPVDLARVLGARGARGGGGGAVFGFDFVAACALLSVPRNTTETTLEAPPTIQHIPPHTHKPTRQPKTPSGPRWSRRSGGATSA